MRIVQAASEMFPFVKTGGLADVMAALSNALAGRGHEVAAFLPGYRSILDSAGAAGAARSHRLKIEMGSEFITGDVYTLSVRPGLTLYLIRREEFYDRKFPYWTGERDYDDNDARFIFFCKAVVEMLRLTDFKADIVHSHDWQTGLLPLLLRNAERKQAATLALKTVFTIHNISYQGIFRKKSFDLTNLPGEIMSIDGIEYYDQICMLKGGILFADRVTTVSPQYLREIQTPEFGRGMDGVVRVRADDMVGILNGIDTAVWNPASDPNLPACYSVRDLSGKKTCREQLLGEFGWDPGFAGPVFGVICRFTQAKGLDLIMEAAELFARCGSKLIVLGSGSQRYEEGFKLLTARYPHTITLSARHDETMSHLIEAGADFFLMPSLFEPCGLNQMYSQAYGTVPLVSRVGGLVDSVVDVDERPEEGTGIMFAPKQKEFNQGVQRAIRLYEDKDLLAAVRRRGMLKDFSWTSVVTAYEQLYHDML
ncbi:MAG: glycogen synthase GlgA [Opitutaceae bacterium]|nr:glycogen synthase GlgA [Opitutaceae bacterium]